MSTALESIAPEVWTAGASLVRQPGGVLFPAHATVVRLPGGELVIYAPVGFDDETAAAIDALGTVAHVVAPNKLHHLYVAAAMARWPKAILHGAPGLAAKRPDLAFARELGRDDEPAWQGVFDVHVLGGAPKIAETVMFHAPSGTLLCADLVFHVTRPPNLRTRMVLALVGAGGGRLTASRAWRFLRSDKAAAAASCERILAWPIEHVVPCHGEPVSDDARAALARGLRRIAGRPLLAAPPA